MPSSRIVELAAVIQEHTAKVDSYLNSQNLPSPSFDISSPAILPLPTDIAASQGAVLEATDELNVLMLGPVKYLASLPVRLVFLFKIQG